MIPLKGFDGLYMADGDKGLVWSVGCRHGANHSGKYLSPVKDKNGYNKLTVRATNGKQKTLRQGGCNTFIIQRKAFRKRSSQPQERD